MRLSTIKSSAVGHYDVSAGLHLFSVSARENACDFRLISSGGKEGRGGEKGKREGGGERGEGGPGEGKMVGGRRRGDKRGEKVEGGGRERVEGKGRGKG